MGGAGRDGEEGGGRGIPPRKDVELHISRGAICMFLACFCMNMLPRKGIGG